MPFAGFKDITRNPFRSAAVVLCALLVAGFSLTAVLVVRGAGESLELAETRFGADIIVVPEGAERQTKSALLMASPMNAWMPSATVEQVRQIPGIEAASAQLYLATVQEPVEVKLEGMDPEAAKLYFPTESLFLVAIDPPTDFAIGPWLPEGADKELAGRESFGGSLVSVPDDADTVSFLGFELLLKTRLRPSGTSLDRALIISLDTADEFLDSGAIQTAQGFAPPRDSISAIMVKVAPGADPAEVAAAIERAVPGAVSLTSPELFASFRNEMRAQRTGMLAMLGVLLALSLAIVSLVFSMIVNQRRREIGVLRALGATRARVVRSLLASAALLAAIGGLSGVVLAGLVVFFLRGSLSEVFGFPFGFPSLSSLIVQIVLGLAIAAAAVLAGAFVPAYRVSIREPALSMRE